MAIRKLPIGIQDFPSLREDGFLYVDKTAFVHKLATEGKVYFLSRPRRFGKSLLVSTLGAYFEGRKELFQGLAIEQLEQDWIEHPVLRLDLNAEKYSDPEGLTSILDGHLRRWEQRFGKAQATSLSRRFTEVIERAHEQTGKRVVVLVDEYDKPLLNALSNPGLLATYKSELKAFYGVLKSADAHLRFVLLTGVTKFGQVSVFSDLNQLQDLSLHPAYATVCGITEPELLANFQPELAALADRQKMTSDGCLAEVRRMYNGYKFEENAVGVYNPFSTLNLLSALKFQDYWFQTGTPTFLVELLKKTDTDLREIDQIEIVAEDFADYRQDPDRPIPVIYQSGYLTIQKYDSRYRLYTLGYPNAEVKNGFLNFLLPSYTGAQRGRGGFHIGKFTQELESGDVDAFLARLRGFFEGIPYDLSDKTERHYHVVFYLVFTLMGQFVRTEVKSAKGRADAVVDTGSQVFVFEFKLNGTAEQALAQIDDKGYAIAYSAEGRRVVKVGVEFDKETRNIGRWLIA
ncbi:MAG TPA: ATP-binding protein [Fibrobacteria bacterium]|nr:ATP-binding protein [Fibrobacteria bacterium]HOX50814.1 ATP-binding protein [Fibrobacteria bacterium]